jgi:hypothetical protein
MVTCRQKIQSNPVAPISIAIAVVAPSYTTWRAETAELQRHIRQAVIEVVAMLHWLVACR